MKSECHSIRKFDLGSNSANIDIYQRNRENDDIFHKELNRSRMQGKDQRMGASVEKKKVILQVWLVIYKFC